MDRACVHRARRLRERIGYDGSGRHAQGLHGLRSERTADRGRQSLDAFGHPLDRAPAPASFMTAHPTFGLSDALYRRMVEIAVDDPNPMQLRYHDRSAPPPRAGTMTLQHEHQAARRTPCATCATPTSNCCTASIQRRRTRSSATPRRTTIRPKLSTFASWVGYDLDGRTDIAWTYLVQGASSLGKRGPRSLDIRERFLTIKHKGGRRQ
jgi:phosphoenolpyruvate carboxylase